MKGCQQRMGKRMRKRNKKKRKQRQVAIISGGILIAVSIVLCIKFIPKHEEQKLQITIPNENQNGTSNNTESNNENEVENNKDQSDDKDKVEESKWREGIIIISRPAY